MKLKSLILGSVAAAGLSTAGFAADLGVLTSLDVCDSLGISGLTISSADNCLAISGGVEYEFNWGDYNGSWPAAGWLDIMAADGVDTDLDGDIDAENDWDSYVEAWLTFVGSASSDFGTASATIKLVAENEFDYVNDGLVGGLTDDIVYIDEAFVQVGDTTTIMAGMKGSIANYDDDEPYNWLGLFLSDEIDEGVGAPFGPADGGHVIQVVSDLGNGVKVKGGLEDLGGEGSAIGVLEYAGEGLTAHVTAGVGGILDGEIDTWGLHAGVTGTFDAFKVRLAGAFASSEPLDATSWNVLGSVEGTFDMFTIAFSGEAAGIDVAGVDNTSYGFGGSVGAKVTEDVSINLGARWFDPSDSLDDDEVYQIAAQIVAAVTETVTLTGEVGVYGVSDVVADPSTDFYGKAELAWEPGGGFESSVGAEIHQNGAYKVTFKASKEFK